LLPLNIGLGVEYAVNLLYNYRTELSKGRTAAEAIRLSIKEVGVAIFLAWFTTAIAFLSFLTASIPPIQTFGVFLYHLYLHYQHDVPTRTAIYC
jgi:predicted RND superfamily exporter protein